MCCITWVRSRPAVLERQASYSIHISHREYGNMTMCRLVCVHINIYTSVTCEGIHVYGKMHVLARIHTIKALLGLCTTMYSCKCSTCAGLAEMIYTYVYRKIIDIEKGGRLAGPKPLLQGMRRPGLRQPGSGTPETLPLQTLQWRVGHRPTCRRVHGFCLYRQHKN